MRIDKKWAGETVEWAVCNHTNPVTGRDTGHAAKFLVLSDGTLYPSPIIEGKYRNCTRLPFGVPVNSHEKILRILAKYYRYPEKAYMAILVRNEQYKEGPE